MIGTSVHMGDKLRIYTSLYLKRNNNSRSSFDFSLYGNCWEASRPLERDNDYASTAIGS